MSIRLLKKLVYNWLDYKLKSHLVILPNHQLQLNIIPMLRATYQLESQKQDHIHNGYAFFIPDIFFFFPPFRSQAAVRQACLSGLISPFPSLTSVQIVFQHNQCPMRRIILFVTCLKCKTKINIIIIGTNIGSSSPAIWLW